MTLDRNEIEETPDWALSCDPEHIKLVLSVFKDNRDTAYTPEEVNAVLDNEYEGMRKKWENHTPNLMIDLYSADLLKKKGRYYIADGDLQEDPESVIELVPDPNDIS